jgi:hypothetical protein
LNPTTIPVFLVEKYGGLGVGWLGIGSETILEMGWVLGRKVKHKYGGKANRQGEVSVKGI